MVPDGWERHPIGKLCKSIVPGRNKPKTFDGSIPWITTPAILGRYVPSKGQTNYVSESSIKEAGGKIIPTGSVIIAAVGDLGLTAIAAEPVVLNQQLHAFVCPDFINNEYLAYWLEAQKAYMESVASKTTIPYMNKTNCESIPVVYPPLPEQTKIAQILSIWDKAIATTEQLLINSQKQKKALMQQLLTGKKRFPGFEGEWREVHLADICIINPKKLPRPLDDKVTFVPMDAVTEDAKLIRHETRKYYEVEKGFTSFADNDVLIAKITPCFENGKGAFVHSLANGIGFGSTEFHVLRAKPNFCPKFIYYLTNSREFRIRGEANMQGSAGQRRVTTDYLRCYKLRIPPLLKEQQEITSVLSSADCDIETLQQELEHLKQEKKALMQQLLTGKRRVKIEG